MELRTHEALDPKLCGTPRTLDQGTAVVDFVADESMKADATGLVHGGFVFGLADHAAMLAINHPNVVLGSSSVRFERPVTVGQQLHAEAMLRPPAEPPSKKQIVDVVVKRDQEVVMVGEFVCFTPQHHVVSGGAQ